MASIEFYSLTDVEVNIECDSMNIEIQPTANLVGEIGWQRTHEAYSLKGDANGGNVYNRDINKAGEITLVIDQLSPYNNVLKDYQNGAEANPKKYLSTITIKHKDGKFNVTANLALPQKHPDQTYGEENTTISYTILTPFLDIQ